MSSLFQYFKSNNITLDGVIHVGAHRGEEVDQYENLGAKNIIWVEPDPEVYKEMEVFLNRAQAGVQSHAYDYAVSNVDHEEVDFHRYHGPDAGYMIGNKGCGSLLQAKGRFENWYKDTIKVETITIDTLMDENEHSLTDYQLLNLDMQGAEMLALEGASKVIDSVSYITTEATWQNPDYVGNVMFDELKEYLEGKGFVETETVNHGPDWGDVLFVKEGT